MYSQNHLNPNQEKIFQHFTGSKAHWLPAYQQLLAIVQKFDSEVTLSATNTYINLLRNNKKFAVIQILSDQVYLGIKLLKTPATPRFQPVKNWSLNITHRVTISDQNQIDTEVTDWLKRAFEAAE